MPSVTICPAGYRVLTLLKLRVHYEIDLKNETAGQKQTSEHLRVMSALPPKADMDQHDRDVRFVPKADIGTEYLLINWLWLGAEADAVSRRCF
jgi:hypothetical protein